MVINFCSDRPFRIPLRGSVTQELTARRRRIARQCPATSDARPRLHAEALPGVVGRADHALAGDAGRTKELLETKTTPSGSLWCLRKTTTPESETGVSC